jgi:hypothetical protein
MEPTPCRVQWQALLTEALNLLLSRVSSCRLYIGHLSAIYVHVLQTQISETTAGHASRPMGAKEIIWTRQRGNGVNRKMKWAKHVAYEMRDAHNKFVVGKSTET